MSFLRFFAPFIGFVFAKKPHSGVTRLRSHNTIYRYASLSHKRIGVIAGAVSSGNWHMLQTATAVTPLRHVIWSSGVWSAAEVNRYKNTQNCDM
jgi:hypothetical protein